jgi:hypothetical protein
MTVRESKEARRIKVQATPPERGAAYEGVRSCNGHGKGLATVVITGLLTRAAWMTAVPCPEY